MSVRLPAVAGTFYPSNPQELGKLIKNFLSKVELPKVRGEIKAIIVPHAGLVYSGQTAAYGYVELRKMRNVRKMRKMQFILLGPAHRVGFEGVVQDAHDFWKTPLGRVEICDLRFEKEKNLIVKDSRPHLQEHSLEVQLPFLQFLFHKNHGKARTGDRISADKFTITPLLTGFGVEYERLAESLKLKAKSCGSILIVSSDLSHYYPQDVAEKIDKKTIKAILEFDTKTLEKEECEACGKTGILTAVYLAKKLGWRPELLHYETSGEATGDFSQVVGYASVGFYG